MILKKEVALKHSKYLILYLLLTWSLYRLFFKFPEEIEELFIKPILWLTPVCYLLYKEKLGLSSLGFSKKKLFPAVYFALALGAGFALEGLILNFLKYKGINFTANIGQKAFLATLGLSLVTAFTEETTFRGYLFNRIWKVTKNEWAANLVTSLTWGLIHVPLALLWWKMGLLETAGYFALITIFGIGSAFVFARTGNILAPILLHVFWEWPIMLFR